MPEKLTYINNESFSGILYRKGDIMIKKYIILFLAVFTVLIMSACKLKNYHDKNEDAKLQNAVIGVIETNGNSDKSKIIFYDDNLCKVNEMPLKYASVGNIFYNPFVYNQKLYIIPQGPANAKDEEKVLEINLYDLDKKEYKIEQLAMNSICADDMYIYTCNTINDNSYINRCCKENKNIEEKIIEHTYISKIISYEGILYAFGTDKKDSNLESYIYIIGQNMELIDKIDITKYGCSQYKAIISDGYLFFSNSVDYKDQPNNIIGIYSIDDKTIYIIELKQDYPLDMVIYNGFLIVSHYDLVRQKSPGISFYNLSTKEQQNYKLNHGAEQMTISGDDLYILSGQNVYKYHVIDMNIELKDKLRIEMTKETNFLSGIFSL